MFSFAAIGTVIPIAHPMGVDAHDLSPAADKVNVVPLNGHGGGDPCLGPIHIRILLALGDDQLPEEIPAFFVEAHQNAPVPLMPGIAGLAVVRADVNAPARD